ncbi:MAG: hypothetical protein JSV44_10380 [Candidatus Zixiibacteriota bacterium]|nr:MAG: hypothetical protein JSV44_10380 [candidate division Zixibacteria bacterium]
MKSTRSIFSLTLVVILAAGMCLAGQDSAEPEKKAPQTPAAGPGDDSSLKAEDSAEAAPGPELPDRIIAYYFHGTRRCASCRKIEAYSHEAIENGFTEELKGGSLQWKVINFDESGNRHYIKDYKLYTKSLVISKIQDGRETEWKNLEKVWPLLGNKENFIKYVQDEIHAFLEKETKE